MKGFSKRSDPWILGAVAVAVRVWSLLDARHAPFWQVPLVDELAYLQTAQGILHHEALPLGAYYAAPGYAWILAAVMGAGLDPLVLKFVQAAVGVLNAWMVYRLATRWFSRREGLVAGLLWAVYPSALFHELLLLKPTFAVAFTLGALLLLSGGSFARRPWIIATGAGVLLGGATLLRGETLLVGLVLAAALARREWRVRPVPRPEGTPPSPAEDPPGPARWRRRLALLAPAVALLVGQGAVVAVPTAMNLARGGGFVVLAYSGGVGFYMGNHPGADGSYLPLIPDRSDARVEERDAVELARRRTGRRLDAAGVSRFWWKEGLHFWRDDPAGALRLSGRKLALLWGPTEIADVLSRRLAARWVRPLRNRVVGAALVLPLALVGLWRTRRHGPAWPARAYLLGSQVALVPFFLFERFRLPMVAAAGVPLAAAALVEGWDVLKARRYPVLALQLVVVVALGWTLSQVRLDRDEVVLRVNLGSMFLESGHYEEALREFQAVQREQPAAWRVEMNIAATYAAMGRDEQALRSLRSVLRKLYAEGKRTGHPVIADIVQCHELSGDLLARQGRLEQARDQYSAALKWRPNHRRIQAKLRSLPES